MELVIASTNSQKVYQIREVLKELVPHATLISLTSFADYTPPAHDPDKSILENAKIKAHHAAKALGKCCLAEQWGLILPSLGEKAKELFRNPSTIIQSKEILNALQAKLEHERSAYIESSIVCATPSGKERQGVGRTEGFIAESERGKGSSDFDAIFIKHDYMKTLAELSPSVRSRISPRRKALEKLLGFFESLR